MQTSLLKHFYVWNGLEGVSRAQSYLYYVKWRKRVGGWGGGLGFCIRFAGVCEGVWGMVALRSVVRVGDVRLEY